MDAGPGKPVLSAVRDGQAAQKRDSLQRPSGIHPRTEDSPPLYLGDFRPHSEGACWHLLGLRTSGEAHGSAVTRPGQWQQLGQMCGAEEGVSLCAGCLASIHSLLF